jgi:hypothetical protein
MSGMIEQLEGGCLCGAVLFIATGPAQGHILVSLPELSKAYRRACRRLRSIRPRSV